jgi:hypothetical protein
VAGVRAGVDAFSLYRSFAWERLIEREKNYQITPIMELFGVVLQPLSNYPGHTAPISLRLPQEDKYAAENS